MNRRRFLESSAAGVAAFAVGGCATPQLQQRQPNIVFIMADDMGYGDLSFTGRADYSTPAIDSLARDGVQLTQSYSAAPVCTPTRVALMTGIYPARHPTGLYEPLTTQPTGLPTTPATLSRLLKDTGYETALIGKWHLGLLPEYHPLEHGFDEFFGFTGAAADYASHIDTEALSPHFYDGAKRVKVDGYLTDLFSDRAVAFVSRERDNPFFLNLQYNAPHWPWQAPGDPVYPDSLRWAKGGSREIFARMMESMDRGVARILDALRARNLERDTIVILTSDNGGERFSHMGPFSQGKMTLYEGGIRVATAARWPGMIPANTRHDQTSITMDWTTTMLRLAGATAETSLDGIDLLPALKGTAQPVSRDLYWRIFQRAKQKALRSDDWKYLQTDNGDFLFNLSDDPGEKNNLVASNASKLEELKQKYAAWEKSVLTPLPLDERYR